jgi:SAM-dependent methyltransferase
VFDTYAEIFAERARSYHSAMEAFPHARTAEFRCVLEPLDELPSGIVCDLPAGGGYLSHHLRTGLEYVGVDPASDFVALGSESARRIIRAELADVPLESGSIDYVVSLAGLHHEPNLGAVFREMRRLVRKGGRVVVADIGHATAPARFLNGFVDRTNPMGHDGRFLTDDTVTLLEGAGLNVLEDAQIDVPWFFAGIDEAASFAARLFGTDRATLTEVADALSTEIGFIGVGSQIGLNWSLRRIICAAD